MLGPPKPRRLDEPITVSLEDLVPQANFYRHLEAKLALSFVREWLQARYAERGRPSIDPVVFFKLQLVMFFEGIRSERKLRTSIAARRSSVATSSPLMPRLTATAVPAARHCASASTSTPNGSAFTKHRQLAATLARSSPNAPRVRTGGRSSAASTRSTSRQCAATTRLRPTRRPCGSDRCGSSHALPRPRSGMACAGSGYAAC